VNNECFFNEKQRANAIRPFIATQMGKVRAIGNCPAWQMSKQINKKQK